MINELQSIIRLQEIDQQIALLQKWIHSLPSHLRDIEKQLDDVHKAHEAAQESIAANQRQRRQYDTEIQGLEQKISKYNHQLLDVKTNEEYKALLHEIEFSKNEIQKIEDKILELMLAAEENEKALQETEQERKRQQQEVAKEKQEAEQATEVKRKEWGALEQEREQIVGALSDSVVDLYHRIAKLRDGVVVAEVQDQICTICHVKLRPQTFNEVMRNVEIIQCSNCSRILYWIPPIEKAAVVPPVESACD